MKNLYFFLTLFPSLLSAQWVQVGSDIYGNPGDAFGPIITVMNGEGNRIAISNAFSDTGGEPNAGHVRVYDLIANQWTQVGNDLQGNVYPGEAFGYSVAMNSSGEYIAVGIRENGIGDGRAGVYEYNGSEWVLRGSFINGANMGDDLGTAIAISADGQTIAISSPGNDAGGTSAGKIQSFKFEAGDWVQVGQDIIGSQEDELGNAISLSASGDILAIASYGAETANGYYTGKVLIYENQNGTWAQLGSDIIGENTVDRLGASIDLNASGDRLVVGILGTDVVGNDNKGSVKVYDFDGNDWNVIGQELIGRIRSNAFGISVGINDDGNNIIVGAPASDPNNPYEGEIWFYKYVNQQWRQYGNSLFGTEVGDGFGVSVAISSNGNYVASASGGSDFNAGDNAGKVGIYSTEFLLGDINLQNNKLKVFPNPTNNILHIQNTSESIKEVILYNQLGQVVHKEFFDNHEITLDIVNYPAGNYLIKIVTDLENSIKKVVKW